MFIEVYNYFRNGKVVKAVGDAYVADEKDPGKLKLRFSNCKNIFDGCVDGVMTLYAIIASKHVFQMQ